jgi:hypothetical protein
LKQGSNGSNFGFSKSKEKTDWAGENKSNLPFVIEVLVKMFALIIEDLLSLLSV